MDKKEYWVRLVHADRPCTETEKTTSKQDAYNTLKERVTNEIDVAFGYLMTVDSFGECFLDIYRRGDHEVL